MPGEAGENLSRCNADGRPSRILQEPGTHSLPSCSHAGTCHLGPRLDGDAAARYPVRTRGKADGLAAPPRAGPWRHSAAGLRCRHTLTARFDGFVANTVHSGGLPAGFVRARQREHIHAGTPSRRWASRASGGCETPARGGEPGLAEVRVGENETFESALRRFNKKIQQSGILAEARRREHYEKPSVKRKKKALAAKKRALKKMRKTF